MTEIKKYFDKNKDDRNVSCMMKLVHAVSSAGGKAYVVGGFVRDAILGKDNKDIDFEIHGLDASTIEKLLFELSGSPAVKKGSSFGVYGIKGYDFDIAMPRKEHCIGSKHTDVAVSVDPSMGVEEASRRRDFTINALMYDVEADEIVDCHNGCNDIASKTIRHVCDETYIEDALRVFRAAQFAARFGFNIAPETIALSRSISEKLSALSGERVESEMHKALMKSDKPSVFFRKLLEMDALGYWFPELSALIDTPQAPEFHPEGNVFEHTMLVIDQAAKVRDRADDPYAFMLTALCHDYGKATTTFFNEKKQRLVAYGHDNAAKPLVNAFMDRLRLPNAVRAYVQNLTALHMQPNNYVGNDATDYAFNHMFDNTKHAEDLLLLARCDHFGRGVQLDYAKYECKLSARLAEYRELMKLPEATADDFMKLGVKPSPLLGEMLEMSHKLHLKGIPCKTAISQTRNQFAKRIRMQNNEA